MEQRKYLTHNSTPDWEKPKILKLPFKDTLTGKTQPVTEWTDGTVS